MIQNLTIYQSIVRFNCVVINHQKGREIVSASSSLVDFGELNDNIIKGLTSVEQEFILLT
jgi:hypothetical protein